MTVDNAELMKQIQALANRKNSVTLIDSKTHYPNFPFDTMYEGQYKALLELDKKEPCLLSQAIPVPVKPLSLLLQQKASPLSLSNRGSSCKSRCSCIMRIQPYHTRSYTVGRNIRAHMHQTPFLAVETQETRHASKKQSVLKHITRTSAKTIPQPARRSRARFSQRTKDSTGTHVRDVSIWLPSRPR